MNHHWQSRLVPGMGHRCSRGELPPRQSSFGEASGCKVVSSPVVFVLFSHVHVSVRVIWGGDMTAVPVAKEGFDSSLSTSRPGC